jgi:hypothetical protein
MLIHQGLKIRELTYNSLALYIIFPNCSTKLLKMKKVFILLITIMIVFPGCKFINEKILKKGSDTLEVYAANLEKELADIETQHFYELEKLKMESQAKIDSIIQYYENELAGKGKRYTGAATGTYYLIVGSFKTPKYAEDYSAKVREMGYNTQIVKAGTWNLVSAENYSSWSEAVKGLELVRSNVSVNSWIYVGR